MKQRVLRIILASSLVVAPFLPAAAGVSVTSDEDLGAVSARGFQSFNTVTPGISGEVNNFDSVALGGSAQSGTSAMAVYNVIFANMNVQQNIADLESVRDFMAYSGTTESTTNKPLSLDVSKTNYVSVMGQTNDVGSVMMDGTAQSGASAFAALNSGYAAASIAQQIASMDEAYFTLLYQSNEQKTRFKGSSAQDVKNKSWVSGQYNNNVSVQLGDSTQSSMSGMALADTAASALNIGQNMAALEDSDGVYVSQANSQRAASKATAVQRIRNDGVVGVQYSNNGSLFMTDNAQENVSALVVADVALSAVNIGQNILSGETEVYNLSSDQKNSQRATNVALAVQKVTSRDAINSQLNANGSVALYGDIQSGATTDVIANVAGSAANVGQNVLYDDMTGGMFLMGSDFHQDNYQTARNDKTRHHWDMAGNWQSVTNRGTVYNEANNNGSVQAGEAQAGASSAVLVNAALSALNSGQNIAGLVAGGWYTELHQRNVQTADNTFKASQYVNNKMGAETETNNAASVQIYDAAQQSASADALVNIAGSAANIGQNIASMTDGGAYALRQSNHQTAYLRADSGQYVKNYGAVAYQQNNDGAVQIVSAQDDADAMSLVNAAVSAVNVGQNVADMQGTGSQNLEQTNRQYAKIGTTGSTYGQTVVNYGPTLAQWNSAKSVQLWDSQNDASGASILNAAGALANIGQNIASVDASRSARISQKNIQSDKFAEAVGVAMTGGPGSNSYSGTNDYDSVYASGSQDGVSGFSVANLAGSAANIGQNILDVDASRAEFLQANVQKAGADNAGIQFVWNRNATAQTNENGSVYLDSSQNEANGLSIINAALSSVNAGQNIAGATATGTAAFAQANLQFASADMADSQAVGNRNVRGQANNDGSVQLLGTGSQNYVDADSLVNVAGSAANIGQNVVDVNARRALFAQLNGQLAIGSEYFTQTVVSRNVRGQVNDNGSVRLDDSQNYVNAMSVANIAASAANIGQNVASVTAGDATAFLQLNAQLAGVVTGSDQSVYSDRVREQVTNNGSVQLLGTGSQNFASAMSLADIASSAANIGQNVASVENAGTVDMRLAAFGQGNIQIALGKVDLSQAVASDSVRGQRSNNGSVQAIDSQNDVSGLSVANMAGAAGNIGQNIANVEAEHIYFAQGNLQAAGVDVTATQGVGGWFVTRQANNNASVQLIDSQSVTNALSIANIAASAANIGQNVADVDAGMNAAFLQLNAQAAGIKGTFIQTVMSGDTSKATSNNASIEMTGSQDYVAAASVANLVGSAGNIGQNIATAQAAGRVDATQANLQLAVADVYAKQDVTAGKAASQTNNNGSIDLINSQNGMSALSVVNAVLSAINVGQNIIAACGNDIDINQTNVQYAYAKSRADQSVHYMSSSSTQNDSSSIFLDGSQSNTSGMVIVNATGSAVNVGQNIAYIYNAKGGGVYQTNLQIAR
jgi:hypothetical protein